MDDKEGNNLSNLKNTNWSEVVQKNSIPIMAAGLAGILSIMLIPMPEFLIDVLIGSNICFSLIILLTAITTKRPLEFSVLPTLLLLTTLFRLSLNVASTKSILVNGSAGKLIESFGNFVVGGNAFVGFLIFLIIIIVQFMVITKGSERISEVSARFKLDAMPLKFMAIEGELNQGLINETDARKRRQEVQAESDFFGAMDGASKFVKGDSIASLIIVAINILAGFATGMMTHGLTFGESLSKYTLLTVGDGLLSTIPSLLISIATGIIVTRPFTEENMGKELANQLTIKSQIFYIISVAAFLLALIPGMNKISFIGLSLGFATIGYVLQKQENQEDLFTEEEIQVEETPKTIDYAEKYNASGLEIEVGLGLVHLVSQEQGGQLTAKLEMIRERTLNNLGFLIPSVRTRDNINLQLYNYRILLNGLEIGSFELQIGKVLAISPTQEDIEMEGIDTFEPAYQFKAKWIDKDLSKLAETKGYTVVDNIDIIASHFENLACKHSYEILNREMVKELVGYVKEKNSTIVEELIPNQLTLGQVQTVLQNLLREGVSIKNLNIILEALSDNAHLDKDPAMLTDFARLRLSKQIISSLDQDNDLYYIGLTYESEQLILENIVQSAMYTNFLALKPQIANTFMKQLEEYAERAIAVGKMPIIVSSTKTRFYIAKFLEPKIPFIKVLSTEEVSHPDVQLQHIGDINLVLHSTDI